MQPFFYVKNINIKYPKTNNKGFICMELTGVEFIYYILKRIKQKNTEQSKSEQKNANNTSLHNKTTRY